MPDLAVVYDSESEDEDYEDDEDEPDSDDVSNLLDFDADDEYEDSEEEENTHPSVSGKWQRLRRWVTSEIDRMYNTRYEECRDQLPRGPSYLHHVLMCLKTERADHFRANLRVSPVTFDALASAIETDPVFSNNSQNPQMPVEEQLAITLYRFGHDGNAASLQSVANWAGVGKGTVSVVTRRVMTAILRPGFMKNAVRWPTEAEKEEAKVYVAKHSCHAWRNGWLFVDGTLVPLAMRPEWYGKSYFDRKSRYSLNFQIVSLPNLRIIDFTFGHTGSTHDASAWEATHLVQDHDSLMEENEWIWADSAYPVSNSCYTAYLTATDTTKQINTWIAAPYKAPERNDPDNALFNNHVSILRIRSEHAIGYLKGRFQSLKNLRVHIKDRSSHVLATYWVAACIGIHSFAMQNEAEERRNNGISDDEYHDPFINDGLSTASSGSERGEPAPARAPTRLFLARKFREKLKEKLFRSKVRKAHARARDRRDDMGGYISDAESSSSLD
ncbi:hypothetical protein HYPSUDRAFT_146140 [Hypholoma sublateritium FD-334 SS-4]|uniref:DDE Tnp4 domain-containing protein n=1 Tax=Hypholoma sublateritium (strain FD-334 SS-4) TaxID=945553 RepID=A0A0D2KSZ4_HYPSF|nr:hypothetical protein HYPSUDRAFT_146140 [Hypholoma sublateritium FD-334 SS-4]